MDVNGNKKARSKAQKERDERLFNDVPPSVMTNEINGVLMTPDHCKAQRDAYREALENEE